MNSCTNKRSKPTNFPRLYQVINDHDTSNLVSHNGIRSNEKACFSVINGRNVSGLELLLVSCKTDTFAFMARRSKHREAKAKESESVEKEATSTEATSGKSPTDVIRVEADLARKLAIASSILQVTVSQLISGELRPIAERIYALAVRRAAEDVKADT